MLTVADSAQYEHEEGAPMPVITCEPIDANPPQFDDAGQIVLRDDPELYVPLGEPPAASLKFNMLMRVADSSE